MSEKPPSDRTCWRCNRPTNDVNRVYCNLECEVINLRKLLAKMMKIAAAKEPFIIDASEYQGSGKKILYRCPGCNFGKVKRNFKFCPRCGNGLDIS